MRKTRYYTLHLVQDNSHLVQKTLHNRENEYTKKALRQGF